MADGLSYRAAALRVGVTYRSISKAVETGRIGLLPDGTVSSEAVDSWHQHRRAPRGGAHRQVAAARNVSTRIPVPEPMYPLAVNTSAAIRAGADDMAMLVLRHLPPAIARELVLEWARLQHLGWVGSAGGGPEPVCVVEGWPVPASYAAWHFHPLFTAPLHVEWMVLEADAAAWRGERDLPPP